MNFNKRFIGLVCLLSMFTVLVSSKLLAQTTNLYYGDSVQLKLDNYRGSLTWQESVYVVGQAPVWKDIPASLNKNIWVTPTLSSQYRGKVDEGTCFPLRYTDTKITLVNFLTISAITDTTESITGTSAKALGEIVRLGGSPTVLEKGMVYDTVLSVGSAKNKTNVGPGFGKFTSQLENLQENKKYYYWAYYKSSGGLYYYGDRKEFKTKFRVEVLDSQVSAISYFNATLNAEVILNDTETIVERGFCYMTRQNFLLTLQMPDTNQFRIKVGTGAGKFEKQLTGLQSRTAYVFRAYAITSKGKIYYSYGSQFSTLIELKPYLVPLREITNNSASFGCYVEGNGNYVEHGLCYATTPNPTISNIFIKYEGNFNYMFSAGCFLNGLTPNTTYYTRYYLKTQAGAIVYSNSISFKTLLSNQTKASITIYPALIDKNKVTVDALYEGPVAVTNKGFYYQRFDYMNIPMGGGFIILTTADSLVTLGAGASNFTTVLDKISEADNYYVKSFAQLSNGTYLESVSRSFFYYQFADIEIQLKSISNIQTSSAVVETNALKVQGSGSGNISARGICYSTEPNPNIDDNKINDGNAEGDKITTITGLDPNTTYYVRAYATINAYGSGYYTYYSDELILQTLPDANISVKTELPVGIGSTTVSLKGTITGSAAIKNRGFCWSSSGTPTIANNYVKESNGTGSYSLNVSGLTMGSTYVYRAFATRTTGAIVYGSVQTFTTVNQPLSLFSSNASGIASNTAQISTTLENNANIQIASKGVCYGLLSEPKISGTKTNEGILNESYSSSLIGLSPNTLYYARAYLTDNVGATYYGNEISFTTLATPAFTVVSNVMGTVNLNLESYGAPFSGSVSGSGTITARGVCYATTNNPSITSSKMQMGTGMGAFNGTISGLLPGVTYYYRAYATSSTGTTVYGAMYATQLNQTLTTSAVSNIQSNSAYSGGNVPALVSGSITAKGVCWGTNNTPLITGSKTTDGVSTGPYSSFMTGLSANNVYYVRAYVTKNTGITYYGNTLSFNTFQPGVFALTTAHQAVTEETVQATGRVVGNGSINERGFCYSTSPNPDITSTKLPVYSWEIDSFTSQISGLLPNTLYYLRSYATSSAGPTYYGNQVSFTTLPAANITVTTNAITNNLGFEATCGGTVSGTGTVTERGIILGIDPNPIAYAMSGNFVMGAGMGSFSGPIEFYMPNTTFYVRAYAKTIGGTFYYGNVMSIPSINLLVNTQSPREVWGVTAKVAGSVSLFGTASIVQKGICYDTIGNPSISGLKTLESSAAGTFVSNLSSLSINTGYYYRAYATTSAGTTYYGKLKYFVTRDHPSIFIETRGTFGKTTTTAIVGGLIDNIGSETVTSRGVCWSQQPDPSITNSKTVDGNGNGIFVSNMSGLVASTVYYFRAYCITNLGKVVYGKTVMMSTTAYDPVTGGGGGGAPNDEGPVIPPNNGGGGTKGGPRYLVFGRVVGPAKISCNSGSAFFDDNKGAATQIIEGEYSGKSYAQASKDMIEYLKKKYPGKGFSYYTEASAQEDPSYRYACIIEYRKKIPAWDCTSVLKTIGYGNSKQEAHNNAVARKNKDVNRGDLATYKVVRELNW